jgi:hypothetical protein
MFATYGKNMLQTAVTVIHCMLSDSHSVSHKRKIALRETLANLMTDKAILCFPLEKVTNVHN